MLFIGLGSTPLLAQIDNNSGSFKIPAVVAPNENNKENPIVGEDNNSNSANIPAESTPDSSSSANAKGNTDGEKAPSFFMLEKEEFVDVSAQFAKMLNEREVKREKDLLYEIKVPEDQNLGMFKTGTQRVRVMCRDHQDIDGDQVSILVNDEVVIPRITLAANFQGFNFALKPGNNKISFKALNQGTGGPNTAQFVVYDDEGKIIVSNVWNLLKGAQAFLVIVKQDELSKN